MRPIIRASTKFMLWGERLKQKGKGRFFWRKSFSRNYEIRLAPFTKVNRPMWISRSGKLAARHIWPAQMIPRRKIK